MAAAACVMLVPRAAPAQPIRPEPPEVIDLAVRPGDARELYAATTFGVLVSRDDGATFHWICDRALGYRGPWKPDLAVSATGRIHVSTFHGLRVSDDGCAFRAPAGPVGTHYIDDVTVGPDGAVWAAASSAARPNDVYVAGAAGTERAEVGASPTAGAPDAFRPSNLRHGAAWWKTVAVAPSAPDRVYVTGYMVAPHAPGEPPRPRVLLRRSDDHGARWTELPVAGIAVPREAQIEIAAVSPLDPDVVFVRSIDADGDAPGDGRGDGGDAIYRSDDAGLTWAAVDAGGPFGAFAVRADGTAVAAVGGRVRTSDDAGRTWSAPVADLALTCLVERADGVLFGCARAQAPRGPAADTADAGDTSDVGDVRVWRSTDAATWRPVLSLADTAGPLICPCDTAQAQVCESRVWPRTGFRLGVRRAAAEHAARCAPTPIREPPPPRDAPDRRAGAPPAAGRTGAGVGAAAALAVLCLTALALGAWSLARRRARERPRAPR